MDTSDNEEQKNDWHDIATSAGSNIPEQEPVEDTGEYDEVEETPSADVQGETNVFDKSVGRAIPKITPTVIPTVIGSIASLVLFAVGIIMAATSSSNYSGIAIIIFGFYGIIAFVAGAIISAIASVIRKRRKGATEEIGHKTIRRDFILAIVIIVAILALIYSIHNLKT